MQPILPIESLVVPVSAQSTQTVPGFPAPLQSFPMPVGAAKVLPQVLADDVRMIAETQSLSAIGVGSYLKGSQDWFNRTGEGDGLFQISPFSIKQKGVDYIYFASKIKKNIAAYAYHGHKSYTVSRSLSCKEPLSAWRFNLFDPQTASQWNAVGGYASSMNQTGMDLMDQSLSGAQEAPSGNLPQEFTWHPIFTQAPSVIGTQTFATLGASSQKWLRLGHVETVVSGNTVDVTAQIEALLPDQEQQARARQFAMPLDWTTQKRDFDTSVLRQSAIPALNCVPLPSFELNVPGLIFENGYRNGFDAVGDFALMAWKPVDGDDSSIWVLNRIRIPIGINLPHLTFQSLNMPAWMDQDFLYPSVTSDPIASLNPGKTIGMAATTGLVSQAFSGWQGGFPFAGGIGSSYAKRYTKRGNIGSFTTEKNQSIHSRLNAAVETRTPVPQSEVNAAVSAGTALTKPFSALGDFPCIGLTSEQAMANAPVVFNCVGGLCDMREVGTKDVATLGQYSFQSARVAETGTFQTVYKNGSGPAGLGNDIFNELDKITTWLNEFYCDPAKYVQVGVYQWKDSGGHIIHSQPIYGHADLLDAFSVTVQFNAW